MKSFYDSYTDQIRKAIDKNKIQKAVNESARIGGFEDYDSFTGREFSSVNVPVENSEPSLELKTIGEVMRAVKTKDAKLGEHPDFVHLKGTEKHAFHYITSVFIDIKGSTNLHRSYDLEVIKAITTTILRAAIHTCRIFGGYIQRLQGDGVFAYFGGKGINKDTSIKMAINAGSFFSYFVKNDLKRIFEQEGIEAISTRIGIDFGDDDKVMWADFGLGLSSELTTNSLHTSLAAKMQQYAKTNGIVVGQNIKERAGLNDDLFSLVLNSNGEVEKRYIWENPETNYRYTQFCFNWFSYLKRLPFIREAEGGTLYYLTQEELTQERLTKLRETTSLLEKKTAYTDAYGNISAQPTGVKNQDHKFHLDE